MAISFENGTTLHRVWGNLADAELLGTFQYNLQAQKIALALLDHEPKGNGIKLVTVDGYSGEMKLYAVDASSEKDAGK